MLSLRLTKLNVMIIFIVLTFLWMFFVYYVVALTPLKSYLIPDFPKADEREKIIENALKVDSLEARIVMYEDYVEKVKAILRGEDVPGYNIYDKDSLHKKQKIDLSITKEDSLFRKQVETEEEFNLSSSETDNNSDIFSSLIFYAPVKGMVSNSYSPVKNHFGTDIVTTKDQVVHSVLNGTVIIAQWTLETGYVVVIQHEKDLVTEYKHCAKILKKVGDVVLSGDAIAIVGNTGELSTGPHLHFELWHKGTALNPEQYISFK